MIFLPVRLPIVMVVAENFSHFLVLSLEHLSFSNKTRKTKYEEYICRTVWENITTKMERYLLAVDANSACTDKCDDQALCLDPAEC